MRLLAILPILYIICIHYKACTILLHQMKWILVLVIIFQLLTRNDTIESTIEISGKFQSSCHFLVVRHIFTFHITCSKDLHETVKCFAFSIYCRWSRVSLIPALSQVNVTSSSFIINSIVNVFLQCILKWDPYIMCGIGWEFVWNVSEWFSECNFFS